MFNVRWELSIKSLVSSSKSYSINGRFSPLKVFLTRWTLLVRSAGFLLKKSWNLSLQQNWFFHGFVEKISSFLAWLLCKSFTVLRYFKWKQLISFKLQCLVDLFKAIILIISNSFYWWKDKDWWVDTGVFWSSHLLLYSIHVESRYWNTVLAFYSFLDFVLYFCLCTISWHHFLCSS